jgi:hypothetical protein
MAWFAVRALLRMLPLSTTITLVLMLGLGGPWQLAPACGSLGLIVGMYFAVSCAIESTEYRITKYGYPHGAAEQARKNSAANRTSAANPATTPHGMNENGARSLRRRSLSTQDATGG